MAHNGMGRNHNSFCQFADKTQIKAFRSLYSLDCRQKPLLKREELFFGNTLLHFCSSIAQLRKLRKLNLFIYQQIHRYVFHYHLSYIPRQITHLHQGLSFMGERILPQIAFSLGSIPLL